MTYSRHYPLLEAVHETLGQDLSKTVAFFKQVDKVNPTRAAVMKRHRITDEKSARFVRANEAAVVETIENLLQAYIASAGAGAPGRIK